MADQRPATNNQRAADRRTPSDGPLCLRRPIAFLYPPQPLEPCPTPREFVVRFPALAALEEEALNSLDWDARMRRASLRRRMRASSALRLSFGRVMVPPGGQGPGGPRPRWGGLQVAALLEADVACGADDQVVV